MGKHPSGLTWERWHWPFKTPEERARIQRWREGIVLEFDTTDNPF